MKNKSTRHKELNTFKFQPFSERISNIDIDIFHKVRHEYESQHEEGQCYFFETIEKWNVLNLTEGYNRFKREVKAYSYITLPQLLLAKDSVIEVLLKHLRLKDPLYLQPLLEIVVAVVKDLQKEFYPHYPQVLEVIVDLLNTKDTDQLEWALTCLAYLFKFLWRSLIKDISNVFHMLLPLLSDSKPEYINNFAAESFAFVARKVKDRESFLGILLKSVRSKKDGISGCGKLLFEVLNGVDGQFHSCAETWLPFLLESLSNENLPQNTLFEMLEQIITNIVINIHPQKCDLLWKTLLNVLETISTKYNSEITSEKLENNIDSVLKLLGQSIEYKSGKLLRDPLLVIQQLIKLINANFPEHIAMTIVKISISLLLAKNIKMPQEQASSLIRKILSIQNKIVVLFFVENMRESSSFKVLILPSFLKICQEYNFDKECFSVLTKILIKEAAFCFCGINLKNWNRFPMDFKEHNVDIICKLQKMINIKESGNDISTNIDEYICALLILPHLTLRTNRDVILSLLEENMKLILDKLNSLELVKRNKLLFLLNVTIECMVHLNSEDILINNFSAVVKKLKDILCSNENHRVQLSSLKIISLIISFLDKRNEVINSSTFEDLRCLFDFFSSPYHEVRLVSTHIFTFFERLPMFEVEYSKDPEMRREDFKFFTICYTVESIEPLVHTYRDQLQNLEKLTWGKAQSKMCHKLGLTSVAVRYLCGVLYMNFQLLWTPILKILESHAHGIVSASKNNNSNIDNEWDIFWSVYGRELELTVNRIQNTENIETDNIESCYIFIEELYESFNAITVKTDFVNYRLLLWKGLEAFPEYAEKYTKLVAKLFLDFIQNECLKSHKDLSIFCNIKKHNEDFQETTTDEQEETFDENSKTPAGKQNVKILHQMLNVFSKIKSPMSMYKEGELSQLYVHFLQHRNATIQKAALDCILTYKHKFLTPYKDHLYNLIDDKTFKHEITSFRIDVESNMVQQEHRKDLIPFVMQIVFSKMMAKTGLRTGGKSSGQMRRNLVFRFLAGCTENEMIIFVRKAFDFDDDLLTKNINDHVQELAKSISLESFLTPRRIQSRLNMLNVVIDQFGGLMGNELLKRLLYIILIAGVSIKTAFDNSLDIYTGYIPMLRNVRSSCIKTLERIFEKFHKYPWNRSEINAVFYTFIWPYLDKLNTDNVHSPTSLLKLFKCWGSNPRYFSLLVKHDDNDEHKYILPHVVNLLANPKCNYIVINCVQEIIENLLKLVPDEEDLEIPVDNLRPIEKHILDRISIQDGLNYGSCILLPHIQVVLQKLKSRLESKNKNLTQKELFILSRISELVWEADISDAILQLLLPVVLKKCSFSEEIVLQFFNTILNLLKNVNEPQTHLRKISPLFGFTTHPSCRKVLTQILAISSDENCFNLISELNAWDIKWLDQPDFERRHKVFKKIEELVNSGKIETNLGILVIYNCYFSISCQKDLSLREISTYTLKILCPYLIKNCKEDLNYILDDTIFALIRTGMKSKTDDVRHECISLLGHLARECPEYHFILRDLNKYSNKEDLEVDFFENLVHLQLHRHARALQRFCQITRDQVQAPKSRTLSQFILPLASFYLCSEKYASKNSVVDAAIETIGVVCRILPWHLYAGLLKYYLTRLRYKVEFQKQLVRLTVAILDSFHFDLSKGHVGVFGNELARNVSGERKIETSVGVIETSTENDVDIKDNKFDGTGEETEETIENEEKEIDETLDEVQEDNSTMEEEIETVQVKLCERITVLCKSTATRVIKNIQTILLPQLHKSLAVLTQYDSSHKVNRKKTGFEREEEDLLRVPISLAVVKLLQRLPKEILDSNLPGVFMKLCTFLKSQLESVRRVTRETLQKIMLTLGPKYLKLLLDEMLALLKRGFHVHVLVYTTHGVLNCLKDLYEPFDVDKVLLTVLDLCKTDLFGILSEEKEIAKIGVKTSEAKSTKSFDTLQTLAKYITEKCMLDLILPIKNILENTHSFKAVHKAQEALRHIALGLVDNKFIPLESLLKFAYGTASESIPQLLPKKKSKLTEKEQDIIQREKEDCLIIPKIPGNRTAYRQANVKTSLQTNAHLLVEFGLRLCLAMLKREKLKDEEFAPFIDPFVRIFKNCLKSKIVKLCTLTLQCLTWVMKFELPSMKFHIKSMAKDMFTILHKYASSGLSKGDNFDLVVATFKAVAVLVRDIKYYTITTDQLKILLLYTEQDMHDHDRQATAFSLLKAIIARKLVVSEMHDIMEKVAEISVTSELNYVRSQARAVFHQFIMEYPLGNTLEKHLNFYIGQLSFELQFGRESAIEMIHTLIISFPYEILKAQSGTLFITLGTRLVNDEVPDCRKMVAECITSMLKKLTKLDRVPLFDMVVLWLKEKNISHRRLAAQLCGLFVNVEKSEFESKLKVITPLLLKQFGLGKSPGKFVKLQKIPEEKDTEEHQRVKDHHHFQLLQLLLKICTHCPSFLKQENPVENLAIHAQTLLSYPHEWVRLAAAQFLGFVLSAVDIEQLATLLAQGKKLESGYLCADPENSIKSLTLDLCDQLQPAGIKTDLAEQVIKNLVFISRVLQKVEKSSDSKLDLFWLTKRMRKIVHQEVIENSSSTVLRSEVFKWIAAVGTALDLEKVRQILHHLLAPLVREMITTEEKNAPLRQLAKEVANLLKKRVGMEEYMVTLSKLQQTLSVKRAERKRSRTQMAVTDPEMYAKKKIRRQEKKKVAKKRKIEGMKGKKTFKKRKLVDLEGNSEVM